MVIKFEPEYIERICMRCEEYEATWQVGRELLCKYCDWAKRTCGNPVDLTYLQEAIPK